jgi:hypothetical protein
VSVRKNKTKTKHMSPYQCQALLKSMLHSKQWNHSLSHMYAMQVGSCEYSHRDAHADVSCKSRKLHMKSSKAWTLKWGATCMRHLHMHPLKWTHTSQLASCTRSFRNTLVSMMRRTLWTWKGHCIAWNVALQWSNCQLKFFLKKRLAHRYQNHLLF